MKKRLIPIALVMGALSANAQVGIGTNKPNKSAELIIESSNRGLLIPNVKLTDTKDGKTITNGNINSLMVFNTSDNSSIKPGYYYWFVDTWHRLTSASEIPNIVVNQFEQILNMQGDKVENLIKQIVLNTSGNVIYEGDKLYHINDAGEKVEINFNDIVKLHETVTTLDYNRDTNILTYVNEEGESKVVDLNVGGIEYSNTNFENNEFITVTGDGTADSPFEITIKEGDNDSMLTTNEKGELEWVSIADIVKSNETVTTLVDNEDGTYTYTNEEGTPVIINVPGSVVENFESIYNDIVNKKITVDGDLYNSFADYLTQIVKSNTNFENNKFIKVDGDGTADNPFKITIKEGDKNSMLITDAEGNLRWSTIADIVKSNETLTTIVKNDNGTYTYTNEAGEPVIIDVPGSVVEQFENIYNKIVNEEIEVNGDTYSSFEEYLTQIVNSNTNFKDNDFIEVDGDGTAGSPFEITIIGGDADSMLTTNEKGELEWVTIADIVKSNETITTIVKNDNGTYTYTNEEGKPVIIDVPGSVVEQFENIYNKIVNEEIEVNGDTYSSFEEYLTQIVNSNTNFKDNEFIEVTGDGTAGSPFEITIIGGDADSMLTTNEKGELEWVTIADIVKSNETLTTIVKNDNGTYTYTNEEGKPVIIDVPGSVVEQFENIYNQIVNEEITVEGDTYNTFEDYLTQIVKSNTNFEDNDFIEVTGDGTANNPFKITIKEGDKNSMLITDAEGNLKWSTIADVVKANETVTTLVDNKDGTYTYTNEAGEPVIIDVPGSVLENFENIYNQIVNEEITVEGDTYNTFEDYLTQIVKSNTNFEDNEFIEVTGDGTADSPFKITIKEGDKNSMLITDAEGNLKWSTIADIVKANETVTTLVDNKDGTYTYTNEKGATTIIDVPGSVVEQFENIYNIIVNEEIKVNGNTYNSFEEYLTQIVTSHTNFKDNDFIEVSGDGTANNPFEITIKEGGADSMLTTNADGDLEWVSKKDATSNTLVLKGNKLTSTVNGVTAEVSLTDENISSSKGITGTGITVGGGENSTLKDVSLSITPGSNNTVMTTKDGTVTWVPQSEIVPNTTNVLSKKPDSNGNTLISTVNNIASETTLIESAANSIENGKLVTTINGKASDPLDLTDAVQATQLKTEVIDGVNTTVSKTEEGNTTKYAVNVSKEAIQAAVTLGGDVSGAAGENTLSKIQGTDLDTQGKVEGNALIFKDGKWVPGKPDINVENVLNGKNLTAALDPSEDEENPSTNTTIEVIDGEGATLVNTSIRVKGESITTDHIQNGTIKPIDLAKAGADNVLSTDSEGTPVWKKEAPRFFYMPAVIFDTAVNGEGERDLYEEYVNQFKGLPHDISQGVDGSSSNTYTGGLIGSQGAPTEIAVYDREELYYYVSYYDTSVFKDLEIDEDGVLRYTVIGNATPRSYMNIVFVIK